MFSTITSWPAKLRVSDKSHIKSELDFINTVNIISQRNRNFYESNWMINTKRYKQFYVEYLTSNNNKHVSMGTFMALKPFYTQSATTNDIKMCCCKKHLHAHWAINALTDCAKAQSLDLDTIESYDTFFEYLTSSCEKETTTYLAWECTPNKREFCKDITTK